MYTRNNVIRRGKTRIECLCSDSNLLDRNHITSNAIDSTTKEKLNEWQWFNYRFCMGPHLCLFIVYIRFGIEVMLFEHRYRIHTCTMFSIDRLNSFFLLSRRLVASSKLFSCSICLSIRIKNSIECFVT